MHEMVITVIFFIGPVSTQLHPFISAQKSMFVKCIKFDKTFWIRKLMMILKDRHHRHDSPSIHKENVLNETDETSHMCLDL